MSEKLQMKFHYIIFLICIFLYSIERYVVNHIFFLVFISQKVILMKYQSNIIYIKLINLTFDIRKYTYI